MSFPKMNTKRNLVFSLVILVCIFAFNNCGKPFRVSKDNLISISSQANDIRPTPVPVTPTPPVEPPGPIDSGIGCKMNLKTSVTTSVQQKISNEKLLLMTSTTLKSSESDLATDRSYREGEFIVQFKSHSLADQSRRVQVHAQLMGTALSEDSLSEKLKEQNEQIQLEQVAFQKFLKKVAPNAVIETRQAQLINAVYVTGLSDLQARELVRNGYKIQRNFKINFMSYSQHPAVNYAPNFATIASIVNTIGATSLHSQGINGTGIKIGIIDTGIEVTHLDFTGKSIRGWSNCPGENFNDDIGHGTHVASIAAGAQGVAPQAQIFMYKVTCNDFSSGAIEALQRAINDGVQVVNMSFSVGIGPDDPLAVAIDSAVSQGLVVVAAAGNCTDSAGPCNDNYRTQGIQNPLDGSKVIGSPAAARSAIAVGITDKNSQLANLIGLPGPTVWSAGSKVMTLAKPDLVAPAQEICAAGSQTVDAAYSAYGMNAISGKPGFFGWCDAQHAVLSGTSMSAPLVAGSVALLRQMHPDWNPDEIKSALRNKSIMNVGNLQGYTFFDRGAGILNIQSSSSVIGKPPVAKLSEVEYNFSKISGLAVSGTASDRDIASTSKFKEYRIYYGKGRNPTAYALLKTSKTPVNSGLLFETAGATDCAGEMVIKLEVEDMNGNISRDYSLFKIN